MTDPTRPPATGYPSQPTNGYPQPQPPPQQQQSYYYPNHNPYPPGALYYPQQPPPRATFMRRILSILIFLFIIMGAVLFIVWLVLRPRIPGFTVTTLSLSSLNLTAASTSLSATWSARFTVYNPNGKLHVYYDEIEARVFYKSSPLARNELPPFDQPTKSQTDMNATLVAAQAYIDPDLGRSLGDDHAKGSVKFNLQVLAIVRFKSGGWSARRRFLRVFCDDLPLDVPPKSGNGALTGGSRRCAVGI